MKFCCDELLQHGEERRTRKDVTVDIDILFGLESSLGDRIGLLQCVPLLFQQRLNVALPCRRGRHFSLEKKMFQNVFEVGHRHRSIKIVHGMGKPRFRSENIKGVAFLWNGKKHKAVRGKQTVQVIEPRDYIRNMLDHVTGNYIVATNYFILKPLYLNIVVEFHLEARIIPLILLNLPMSLGPHSGKSNSYSEMTSSLLRVGICAK